MLRRLFDALVNTFRNQTEHAPTPTHMRAALMARAGEARELAIRTQSPRASAYWTGYIKGLQFAFAVTRGRSLPIVPYGEESESL